MHGSHEFDEKFLDSAKDRVQLQFSVPRHVQVHDCHWREIGMVNQPFRNCGCSLSCGLALSKALRKHGARRVTRYS